MNLPFGPGAPEQSFPALRKYTVGTARTRSIGRYQKIFCGLIAMSLPFAAAFAQSSSSPQQPSPSAQQSSSQKSASQRSSTQAQPQSQAQPASSDQPPQKEDSPAEAARTAKAKKPAAAKNKVYTEDDLSGIKGPGVSVVGDTLKNSAQRAGPSDANGDYGPNKEEYWRGRARQFLDAIAQTDEQITQKKEEIKKFGSGGFDVTTGRKDNIAYIHDRNGQLNNLEKRKADLEKKLEDLQDEGRKAGAPASWFR